MFSDGNQLRFSETELVRADWPWNNGQLYTQILPYSSTFLLCTSLQQFFVFFSLLLLESFIYCSAPPGISLFFPQMVKTVQREDDLHTSHEKWEQYSAHSPPGTAGHCMRTLSNISVLVDSLSLFQFVKKGTNNNSFPRWWYFYQWINISSICAVLPLWGQKLARGRGKILREYNPQVPIKVLQYLSRYAAYLWY